MPNGRQAHPRPGPAPGPKKSRARTQASMLAKVQTLYTHERHEYIQGTANGGFLVRDKETNKQRMYPGVLDRLSATLYPFDPQDPWKRSKYGITARRSVQALPVHLPGASGASQCALSGAQHGDLVHRQMEHWANCVKVFGIEQGTQAFLGGARFVCEYVLMHTH